MLDGIRTLLRMSNSKLWQISLTSTRLNIAICPAGFGSGTGQVTRKPLVSLPLNCVNSTSTVYQDGPAQPVKKVSSTSKLNLSPQQPLYSEGCFVSGGEPQVCTDTGHNHRSLSCTYTDELVTKSCSILSGYRSFPCNYGTVWCAGRNTRHSRVWS